ncbi:hypothetical protein [Methylobacterium nigriterrae]|uniref:hypothetical protein n=1 Tax=Methylobacterium nigriterrae TaxID=3127512 RepID=UPI00301397D8
MTVVSCRIPGAHLLAAVLLAAALPAVALLPTGVLAADVPGAPRDGRFVAACEDLGRFCTARACGRDQIAAALGCRALCPSSVVLRVEPAACAILSPVPLRRRG